MAVDEIEEFRKQRDEKQAKQTALAQLDKVRDEELKAREKVIEKKENKITISKPTTKKSFRTFIGLGKVKGYKKPKSFLQDRIKVMRYRNMLEKQRLKNLLANYKLKNRVELLRRQGKLPIPQVQRIVIPKPFFASPQVNSDLASVYGEANHLPNDLFGSEDYFGGENYYDEEFFHSEFNEDPLAQLGIRFKYGVNPLLY